MKTVKYIKFGFLCFVLGRYPSHFWVNVDHDLGYIKANMDFAFIYFIFVFVAIIIAERWLKKIKIKK